MDPTAEPAAVDPTADDAAAAADVDEAAAAQEEEGVASVVLVECPEGMGAGDLIVVDWAGGEIEVQVPEGVSAGDEFEVDLPAAEPADEARGAAGLDEREPEQEPEQEPEPEPEFETEPEPEQPLPWGWAVAHSSRSGRRYYWNTITGESNYAVPTQLAVPLVAKLPCGVATLQAAEQAEAAGDFVAAMAGYNTVIAEALGMLGAHPPLRALVDELMERALSLRPRLLEDEGGGGGGTREGKTATASTPKRDQLIDVDDAARATPSKVLGAPPRARAPVPGEKEQSPKKSRGYNPDPKTRHANRRVVQHSSERAVSADATHGSAHEYDERTGRHHKHTEGNHKRTGSSKAVAWGNGPESHQKATTRFQERDPTSHFFVAGAHSPGPPRVITREPRADDGPATVAADGVGWGPPTQSRFDERNPQSHLFNGSIGTPCPNHTHTTHVRHTSFSPCRPLSFTRLADCCVVLVWLHRAVTSLLRKIRTGVRGASRQQGPCNTVT